MEPITWNQSLSPVPFASLMQEWGLGGSSPRRVKTYKLGTESGYSRLAENRSSGGLGGYVRDDIV